MNMITNALLCISSFNRQLPIKNVFLPIVLSLAFSCQAHSLKVSFVKIHEAVSCNRCITMLALALAYSNSKKEYLFGLS